MLITTKVTSKSPCLYRCQQCNLHDESFFCCPDSGLSRSSLLITGPCTIEAYIDQFALLKKFNNFMSQKIDVLNYPLNLRAKTYPF